ncbi:hypothetical protein [Amycolatopsis jejuensis]|uniref:hypothetical protein n=1 Tax=Amycolatopsis jejuensis TaxID=330084 RepID=UPI0005276AC7
MVIYRWAEFGGQPGDVDDPLAVVVVDVEQAALRAGGRGRFGLVDRGRDATDVQDAGEDETAEPGPTIVTGVVMRRLLREF